MPNTHQHPALSLYPAPSQPPTTRFDTTAAHRCCDRLARIYRRPFGAGVALCADRTTHVSLHWGQVSPSQPILPDDTTLFEIGSITKIFTACLLARQAEAGIIDPDAPLSALVPDLAGTPPWITPRALATHSAGLPRLHPGVSKRGWTNPYQPDDEAVLFDWLRSYRPRKRPKPAAFAYSNLGMALLGLVLGRMAGSDYLTALKQSILDPLGLADTGYRLSPSQQARLAQPHRTWGKAVPAWDFDGYAAAGALRSSPADLLRFGRAVLDAHHGEGPLATALACTLRQQFPPTRLLPPRGLGWMMFPDKETGFMVAMHDGATHGSSATLILCPDAGVLMLAMAGSPTDLRTILRQARAHLPKLTAALIRCRS